jgi:hypothetical protein
MRDTKSHLETVYFKVEHIFCPYYCGHITILMCIWTSSLKQQILLVKCCNTLQSDVISCHYTLLFIFLQRICRCLSSFPRGARSFFDPFPQDFITRKFKWSLGYGLDDRGSRVWFPAAHPASYSMSTRDYFPGGKAAGAWSWPLTSI